MLKGIATSSGIAIGKVYKLEQPETNMYSITYIGSLKIKTH